VIVNATKQIGYNFYTPGAGEGGAAIALIMKLCLLAIISSFYQSSREFATHGVILLHRQCEPWIWGENLGRV